MKAKILKNMMVDGRLLQSGDIVDVKGWKHAKALSRNRYILLIEEEEKPVKTAKAEAPVEPAVEKPKTTKKSAPKTEE